MTTLAQVAQDLLDDDGDDQVLLGREATTQRRAAESGARRDLGHAGKKNLAGKVLLDVANPTDAGEGSGPVTLAVANTDSLAEQIWREFPEVQVVKALMALIEDRRPG